MLSPAFPTQGHARFFSSQIEQSNTRNSREWDSTWHDGAFSFPNVKSAFSIVLKTHQTCTFLLFKFVLLPHSRPSSKLFSGKIDVVAFPMGATDGNALWIQFVTDRSRRLLWNERWSKITNPPERSDDPLPREQEWWTVFGQNLTAISDDERQPSICMPGLPSFCSMVSRDKLLNLYGLL